MEESRKLKEEVVTARELMTENPATLTAQATIAEAWDLMRELEIRHVPVIQDGALVGMLSDRDLARVDIGSLLVAEGAGAAGQDLGTPIAGLMSTGDLPHAQPAQALPGAGLSRPRPSTGFASTWPCHMVRTEGKAPSAPLGADPPRRSMTRCRWP